MFNTIKAWLMTSWEGILRYTACALVPAVAGPLVVQGTDPWQLAVAGLTGGLVAGFKVTRR